jgi:hypothetical protein
LDAAVGDGLRETSRKLANKPMRGGLPNALLGRLALADAPGELEGIAHALTVLLPWGALLAAVAGAAAGPKPDGASGLRGLRGICRVGAELRIVFGYGGDVGADASAVTELALPAIDEAGLAALAATYREVGFEVTARRVGVDTVRALGTAWSGRLAWSGKARTFVEVSGTAR